MIKHSVSRWCFGSTPLDSLCEKLLPLGITGIDLLKLEEIPTVILFKDGEVKETITGANVTLDQLKSTLEGLA